MILFSFLSMSELDKHNNENNLLASQVAQIIREARQTVYRAVNFTMVLAYWNIGKLIVEDELHWERADYGKAVLRNLSQRLTKEFGKGFDERELRKMCQFYRCFEIRDTLRPELSWSHYRRLISVESSEARMWYMNEAADSIWSTRQLDRQISTLYYDRLLASQNKQVVIQEADEKLKAVAPEDFI